MKPRLVKLVFVSSCALLALPAMPVFAQSSAQPRNTAATALVKAPADAPKALTVAASDKTATLASTTTATAAGREIVLSDGIVANATMAQIHSPAPGFEYER